MARERSRPEPEAAPVFRVLRRRLYVAAPAERVWPWIVEPERVRQYHLGELIREPERAGDPIRYAGRLSGEPVIAGTVTELVPGRRLAHTFQFQCEPREPESRVTYELLRYGDAMCCLELRHEGLAEESQTLRDMETGWDVVLCSLKTVVETGEPLPWPGRPAATEWGGRRR